MQLYQFSIRTNSLRKIAHVLANTEEDARQILDRDTTVFTTANDSVNAALGTMLDGAGNALTGLQNQSRSFLIPDAFYAKTFTDISAL